MKAIDSFYFQQEEPVKSVFMALRDIILAQDQHVTTELKYGMPFFCYKGKMFCYLWLHKKYGQPYIGLVEGKHFDQPFLLQEKRSRMKIMLLDPDRDLPVRKIRAVIKQALDLYRTGIVKISRC
ncbi:MAG: DUF1801 domain-containing protein [Chitinophagaceae bacterium]